MASPPAPTPVPVSPSKRKVSLSDSQQKTGRQIKRRASKACASCRARKVRCNVVENGVPCTNCHLDSVDCVLLQSRRRRHAPAAKKEGDPSQADTFSKTTEVIKPISSPNQTPPMVDESTTCVDDLGLNVAPDDSCSQGNIIKKHVPHMIYQTQGQRVDSQQRMRRLSLSQYPEQLGQLPLQRMRPLLPMRPRQQTNVPPRLPVFVKPYPLGMKLEDLEYLAKKGAFSLPPKALRLELLRSFIQYVYPFMPLLELRQFLQAVLSNKEGGEKVSFLLYQSVMFVGSAFIDMNHIRAAGFDSRRAARKALFAKARLLYDFDYESDRLTLIQSLLLMAFWYESPDDQKDTWHWIGICLSLAQTMRLHRDPACSSMSNNERSLRRRIWWSLYMRDRMIALGMRRTTRLQDADCNVPMLSLYDFDMTVLPSEITQKLRLSFLQSQEQLIALAMMCIEKAKLCRIISHVLESQYKGVSSGDRVADDSALMLLPRRSSIDEDEMHACDVELEDWHNGLPIEAQHDSWSGLVEEDKLLFLHRALLRMNYLTAVSAFHRPRVLSSSSKSPGGSDVPTISRMKVRHAAVETTEIAQQLQSRDLIRRLPTEGVTVLLPALIVHLLDLKSSDEKIRAVSLSGFQQCMRVLNELREIYASAEYATLLLESALRKAGLHLHIPDAQLSIPRNHSSLPNLTPPPEDPFGTALFSVFPVDGLSTISKITPPDSFNGRASVDSRRDSASEQVTKSEIGSPSKDFASQSPYEKALTSLNFMDAIVLPYDYPSVESKSAVTPAESMNAFASSQGESSAFELDLDMMVDFSGKAMDTVGLDMDHTFS